MRHDGTCNYYVSVGMCCSWDSYCGLCKRSWHHSAVINSTKTERIFLERSDVVHNGNVLVAMSDDLYGD